MCDEHHRARVLLIDAQKLVLHDLARLGVQRSEWLVHEQDVGFHRERPREADALLHPAGQLVREGTLEADEAHEIDVPADALRDRRLRCPSELEPVGDIGAHPLPRHEAEVLEDHRDVASRPTDRSPVDEDAAAVE